MVVTNSEVAPKPFPSIICNWLQPLVGDLQEPNYWRFADELERSPKAFFFMVVQLRDELDLHLGLDPTVGNCDIRLCPENHREQLLDRLFYCAICLLGVANHDMTGMYAEFDWELFERFIFMASEIRLAPVPNPDHIAECVAVASQLYAETAAFASEVLSAFPQVLSNEPTVNSALSRVPNNQSTVSNDEIVQTGFLTVNSQTRLPFNLRYTELPQQLNRVGYPTPVVIKHDVQWKLMKELMAAYPHPVSENVLSRVFSVGPNERKNAKRLRKPLAQIGLNYSSDWTLSELERQR
jgi:hypothetical protein